MNTYIEDTMSTAKDKSMKTFITERVSDKWAGEMLEAESWEIAEKMCPEGYTVLGELIEIVEGPELDNCIHSQLIKNIARITDISNRLLTSVKSRKKLK